MTEHAHHTTHAHQKPQENGLAIAAFILGILSLTGLGAFTGVPAIITGFMSLKNPVNKGLGIAGLVMGAVSTVLTIFVILFFLLWVIMIALSSPSATHMQEMPYDDYPTSGYMRSI